MKLASIFTSYGVLQRDLPLPIWGSGEPGEPITVHLAGHECRTEVDSRGHWMLRLPPLSIGGPYALRVVAPSGETEVTDLLVGDVWLCSGQSNMEWKRKQCGQEWAVGAMSPSQVRLLTVATPANLGSTDAVDGGWKICDRETLAEFSAVGGYFGLELYRSLGIPIGLICNAWGGTRVQAWMSREALMQDPAGRDEVSLYESYGWEPRQKVVGKTFADWERADAPQDPGNVGLELGWAASSFDDSSWPYMSIPEYWNTQGHPHSGILWFRKTIFVPQSWLNHNLDLSLGAIERHDETWVNGELVGSMGWEIPDAWNKKRIYSVPSHLIGQDGRVVIAVRVRSHVYTGGLIGPSCIMGLHRSGDASDTLCLSGAWHYNVERDWGVVVPPDSDWGASNPNSPHILFDNRIAPLLPYGLRGVVWYQGESNVSEAKTYRRFLVSMIRDWRRSWGQGNFPFVQVQLANYQPSEKTNGKSQWAELREAQLEILTEPDTGMAVTIDIGEGDNIHPRNKRDVAQRLARWVLAETFGFGGHPSGPLFSEMRIEGGGRVRCLFRYAGGGLVSSNKKLRHFTLAGRARKFFDADAIIEGESVLVSCKEVSEPMAVRYAWADNPDQCNLYNRDDLPASPFRSDSWLE